MNEAHMHLLVNHFPIIGLILGTLVLILGILLKSDATRNTAAFLLLVSTIFAIPAFTSGEGAEEIVEHMPGMDRETHHLIHEHEERAETFMFFAYGIIALSVVALFAGLTKKKWGIYVHFVTLLVALGGCFMANEVGKSGGQIAHLESRENFKAPEDHHEHHEEGEHDDHD
ncbi:MAG: hypothetical protein EP338_06845 [Bacteroidetes bacterium]|nr:MAG: hypothetical protein EP338_06845 [Bacteroidota bacterium]